MKNPFIALALYSPLVAFLILTLCAGAQTSNSPSPAASVNPFIGTGGDPDDGINLYPGATMPFGMVQLSPDTEDHGFGYHYIHTKIKGFSLTHMSGPGCADQGDVFFSPTTGPVVTEVNDFQSPYSHKMETASPGYYQVQLLQWGINAELSATEHTGVARLTFPGGKAANFILPISHTLNKTAGASVRIVGDSRIEGYVENHAFCAMPQTYKVYFVIHFSRPFSSFGTWTSEDVYSHEAKIAAGNRTVDQSEKQKWVGAYAGWPSQPTSQTITAKIGISYVDVAGAEKNLASEAEGKDFSAIRSAVEQAWNKELSVIDVSGGTPAQRRVFYSAFYHSLLMPNRFDDADGRYLGFDGQIHTISGHHIYANFSGWDIYRSEMPLLAMIEPARMQDMAQSIVLMYQQGGWIDRWPQINLYTNDMVGSPLTISLATAWLDGLHGFDMKAAWEGMLKDATQPAPPGHRYKGEDGIEWINQLHYAPDDKLDYGSVAKTQEYTLAYASLYRLAVALGKTDDAKMLYQRALYYRNLFDPDDKFFRPRNADGTWVHDFNPAQSDHGFVEGTGWHYQSFAPADLAWLVNAVGRDLFNERMTEFFNYPVPGWYAQYYNPYNETDMQAPFVFNFSGEPWKAQRAVRRVLQENYLDTPDGIPGNDDCGAMSSWAVLSMMGIYSVDPASLAYELVAPTLSKVVIHLQPPYEGKTFTIEASPDPESKPYIQHAKLNGHVHMHNWISFEDIRAGGALNFTLGPEPNHAWGSGEKDAPPSLSDAR